MRSVIRFTLKLYLAIAVSLVAVVVFGRQQPASDRITALHLTDCTPPCWIGVVPGQTSLREARRRVGEVFGPSGEQFDSPTQDLTSLVAIPLPDADNRPRFFLVYLNGVQGITEGITLPAGITNTITSPNAMPSLGEIVSLLGTPSCVLATPAGLWNVFYDRPSGVIVIQLRAEIPQWTQPIESLAMLKPDQEDQYCRSVWRNAHWRGLVSLNHYQRGP